jgi:nitrite reductase/ring-hydroxylating ferredoxin subunit
MAMSTEHDAPPPEGQGLTRRAWLAGALMGTGLLASYGTLAFQFLSFLLPERLKGKTRLLFVGQVDRFALGSVQTIMDLKGNEILVKRNESGFQAFSSVCPHLGCRVQWVPQEERFFCPCHRGVFNADGKAVAGPPADAGQRLADAPLVVDQANGVVYLEVEAPKKKGGEA